jgi:hypothetical protein
MPSILANTSAPVTGQSIANAFGDSLLSTGRAINRSGIGLSGRARQGIEGFISATQGGYNALFSLATGPSLSNEGLLIQIQGLRATVPVSQLSPKMLQQIADEILKQQEAENKANGLAADGSDLATGLSPSSLGRSVNTTA